VKDYKRNDGGGRGIEASKVDRVTSLGEIHANGLSGVKRLEAAFEVIEGRLSISGDGGFFGEVEGTLRVVVVLGARQTISASKGGSEAVPRCGRYFTYNTRGPELTRTGLREHKRGTMRKSRTAVRQH
jgi:hypothetical protein